MSQLSIIIIVGSIITVTITVGYVLLALKSNRTIGKLTEQNIAEINSINSAYK
jgi:hypothetical protein